MNLQWCVYGTHIQYQDPAKGATAALSTCDTVFHMCAHDETTVRRGELDFCYVSFLSLSLSFGIVACARLETVGALL